MLPCGLLCLAVLDNAVLCACYRDDFLVLDAMTTWIHVLNDATLLFSHVLQWWFATHAGGATVLFVLPFCPAHICQHPFGTVFWCHAAPANETTAQHRAPETHLPQNAPLERPRKEQVIAIIAQVCNICCFLFVKLLWSCLGRNDRVDAKTFRHETLLPTLT